MAPPPRTNVPECPGRCGYDEQPQTPNQDPAVSPQSWIDLKQDADTGIEQQSVEVVIDRAFTDDF